MDLIDFGVQQVFVEAFWSFEFLLFLNFLLRPFFLFWKKKFATILVNFLHVN